MIVWGGASGPYLNDGGRYNPATNTWAAGGTAMVGAPGVRNAHTAIWTGTEMIVWGGYGGASGLNDGGRYNPATNTWAAGGTAVAGAPAVRFYHTVVWTGTEMIVWGGNNSVSYLNDGGRYNPATNTWAAGGTSTSGAPGGRSTHTAVWTGTEMIVWGGAGAFGFPVNDGGRWRPYSLYVKN